MAEISDEAVAELSKWLVREINEMSAALGYLVLAFSPTSLDAIKEVITLIDILDLENVKMDGKGLTTDQREALMFGKDMHAILTEASAKFKEALEKNAYARDWWERSGKYLGSL